MSRIGRRAVDHLLWDSKDASRQGIWIGLWATRKLWIALAGAAVLTWAEWVEHHPLNIALIAMIHFVLVLALIALVIRIRQ